MPDTAKKIEKAGGHGLMLVVIALLILLLGAIGVLAYYLFTNPYGSLAGAPFSRSTTRGNEGGSQVPIFQKMDTFVVNLSGNSGALLQVDMQAQLRDEGAKKIFTELMPKVRSAVILLLSSKTADELSTSDGKLKLRTQVERVINEALGTGSDGLVLSILFTSFIIQSQ